MRTTRALAGIGGAAALVLSVGCGDAADSIAERAAEKAAEQASGGDVDLDADGGVNFRSEDGSVEVDADGNVVMRDPDGNVITSDAEGNMTVSGDEGETTYAGGDNSELPEGWPDFLALPDDATILTSQTNTANDVASAHVMAEVDGDLKELHDGYKAALEDQGFEIGSDITTETFASVSGEKGDQSVSITIGTSDDTPPVLSITVTGL